MKRRRSRAITSKDSMRVVEHSCTTWVWMSVSECYRSSIAQTYRIVRSICWSIAVRTVRVSIGLVPAGDVHTFEQFEDC